MTPARWNEIIRTAAEQAVDECVGAPTIQAVALRAATLAAEWVCEEMAMEEEEVSEWKLVETAPKDGTWILLRGRNSADAPMIPVVCAWRRGDPGEPAWRDSASLRDMTNLVADVPAGSSGADWMLVPE